MRSIRMRLRTVGCPMNAPTDNSKLVPLKWFVFIIKYLPLLARADDIRPYKQEHILRVKSELPYSTHTGKD